MTPFAEQRETMVERQIMARGLDHPALLAAFRAVPREAFVADHLAARAYDDGPLPIESGQTISQPYIVALMIDAAGIGAADHVLEVGAGSGYAAAVIGQIAAQVVSIERHHELAELAAERIACLGYANVRIVEGDGTRGWPEGAPYDAIFVAASGSAIPPDLVAQLKPDGRLVMPVGGRAWVQTLIKLTKRAEGTVEREELCGVRFVPLIGD